MKILQLVYLVYFIYCSQAFAAADLNPAVEERAFKMKLTGREKLKELEGSSLAVKQLKVKQVDRKQPNTKESKELEKQTDGQSVEVYSFRPLLIQGGKKINKSLKNIKVDVNSVVESEVFFIDTDFKKRIFLDEGGL